MYDVTRSHEITISLHGRHLLTEQFSAKKDAGDKFKHVVKEVGLVPGQRIVWRHRGRVVKQEQAQ